jgi:hypothetical protein
MAACSGILKLDLSASVVSRDVTKPKRRVRHPGNKFELLNKALQPLQNRLAIADRHFVRMGKETLMTLSISGTLSAQPADTPDPAPAVTQQAPQTQPSDTVAMSQSAQVSQLHQQGQNLSEIRRESRNTRVHSRV